MKTIYQSKTHFPSLGLPRRGYSYLAPYRSRYLFSRAAYWSGSFRPADSLAYITMHIVLMIVHMARFEQDWSAKNVAARFQTFQENQVARSRNIAAYMICVCSLKYMNTKRRFQWRSRFSDVPWNLNFSVSNTFNFFLVLVSNWTKSPLWKFDTSKPILGFSSLGMLYSEVSSQSNPNPNPKLFC